MHTPSPSPWRRRTAGGDDEALWCKSKWSLSVIMRLFLKDFEMVFGLEKLDSCLSSKVFKASQQFKGFLEYEPLLPQIGGKEPISPDDVRELLKSAPGRVA